MNVRELIEKLRTLPPDMDVMTEGCDCWGVAADARVQTDAGYDPSDFVLITRPTHDD